MQRIDHKRPTGGEVGLAGRGGRCDRPRLRRRAETCAALACAAVVSLLLLGCREEEQSRALIYDKGTYHGVADTPLSDAQVRALQRRPMGRDH